MIKQKYVHYPNAYSFPSNNRQDKPIIGHRRGSLQASWAKIKQATASDIPLIPPLPPNHINQSPSGEIVIWRESLNRFEFWHHYDGENTPPKSINPSNTQKSPPSPTNIPPKETRTSPPTPSNPLPHPQSFNEGLYYTRHVTFSKKVAAFAPLGADIAIVEESPENHYTVTTAFGGTGFPVPTTMEPPFFVKAGGDNFFAVASSSGGVLAFKSDVSLVSRVWTAVATEPIFDVRGSWLVWSPGGEKSEKSEKLQNPSSSAFTTAVRLPPPGPLLNRAVAGVSAGALNKLYNLGESTSRRVRSWHDDSYLSNRDLSNRDLSNPDLSNPDRNPDHNQIRAAVSLVALALYPNRLNPPAIAITDLTLGEQIGKFAAPGGILCVSVCPHDLILAHASANGDTIFLWDLNRLPNEVALVGKFPRGNTHADIPSIVWHIGSTSGPSFTCFSRKAGSIHWYSFKYIYDTRADSAAWVLPSAGAIKLFTLPMLAFLDHHGRLVLVDPSTRSHSFLYQLADMDPLEEPKVLFSTNSSVNSLGNFPLAHFETDTCSPWLSVINKNALFFRYKAGAADANIKTTAAKADTAAKNTETNARDSKATSANASAAAKDSEATEAYTRVGPSIPSSPLCFSLVPSCPPMTPMAPLTLTLREERA